MKITLERVKHILGLPSILVIATILFANAFMQLLSDLFDDSILLESILVAVLAAVVATCLMKTLATLHNNVNQITNHIGQPGTLRMKKRKGLILICGLSSAETSSAAMKVLQVGESLEFVALVGTKETNHRGVETFIEKTLLKTAGRDLADTHVRIWSHNTSEFIADAQTATSEAIMWMLRNGLDRNDIVVDVTAGRRSFCHGAFIAAEAEKIETQLVSDAWDHTTNKRVTGEETIKLIQEHY